VGQRFALLDQASETIGKKIGATPPADAREPIAQACSARGR
jgi:hypothetical protein